MKAPVKIDDLMEEWKKDSSIDHAEPVLELSRIPSLHAKYLNIRTYHNMVVKKLTNDYNTQKQIKMAWYRGDLNNPEDLAKYKLEANLQPCQTTAMAQIKLDGDHDLNTILAKKMIHEEIVDYCESVIKEIGARTYQLNSIVRFIIFSNGS